MPLRDRFARAYRFESNTTSVLVSFAVLALVLGDRHSQSTRRDNVANQKSRIE